MFYFKNINVQFGFEKAIKMLEFNEMLLMNVAQDSNDV